MSHQVSPKEIKRIAKLARLKLTPAEINQAATDLDNILGHFSAIADIDTENTPTSDDVTGLTNVMRPDQADPANICPADQLLDLAPVTKDRFIQVKAVFEE